MKDKTLLGKILFISLITAVIYSIIWGLYTIFTELKAYFEVDFSEIDAEFTVFFAIILIVSIVFLFLVLFLPNILYLARFI